MATDIEIIVCQCIGDLPRWAYLYSGSIDAALATHKARHGEVGRVFVWKSMVFVETQDGKEITSEIPG